MIQIDSHTFVNPQNIIYVSIEQDLRLVGLENAYLIVNDLYYKAIELFLREHMTFVPLNVIADDGETLCIYINPSHITCVQVFPDNSSFVTLTDGSTIMVLGNVASVLA